jgi:hypothetical protein
MTLSSTFHVQTVREMNWLGTKNGELLAKAASNDFDDIITADRNMYYQQNLRLTGCDSDVALPAAELNTNSSMAGADR